MNVPEHLRHVALTAHFREGPADGLSTPVLRETVEDFVGLHLRCRYPHGSWWHAYESKVEYGDGLGRVDMFHTGPSEALEKEATK